MKHLWPPTAYTPIPLDDASTARMAIMAVLLKIRNRSKSAGICRTLRLLHFHYASSTLHIRSCYASHDSRLIYTLDGRQEHSTTLPLRQMISSYASSALTTTQWRSYYDLSGGAALMLCLETVSMKIGDSASTDHQPSNKMYNI